MRQSREYIPPRSGGDPLHPEEVIPLLEAIARHTGLFVRLRDEVYPLYEARPTDRAWIDALEVWMVDLNLRFSDDDMNERLVGWIAGVLECWKSHPDHRLADPPRVDQGYFDHETRVYCPRPDLTLILPQFNENAESWQQYQDRIGASFAKVMQAQQAAYRARLKQYGMTESRTRQRLAGRDDTATMYVLHKYRDLSFGQIAKHPSLFPPSAKKPTRQAVEKRIRGLIETLGLST